MTDPIRHISSPSELADLTSQTSSASAPQTIQIHILAPLAEAETLVQCLQNARAPLRSEHNYLDLSSLSKNWRAAWADVPASTCGQSCL